MITLNKEKITHLFTDTKKFHSYKRENDLLIKTKPSYDKECGWNTNKIIKLKINEITLLIEGINSVYVHENIITLMLELTFDVSTNDGYEGTMQEVYIPLTVENIELVVYNNQDILAINYIEDDN